LVADALLFPDFLDLLAVALAGFLVDFVDFADFADFADFVDLALFEDAFAVDDFEPGAFAEDFFVLLDLELFAEGAFAPLRELLVCSAAAGKQRAAKAAITAAARALFSFTLAGLFESRRESVNPKSDLMPLRHIGWDRRQPRSR
jgi:hypothetical protein